MVAAGEWVIDQRNFLCPLRHDKKLVLFKGNITGLFLCTENSFFVWVVSENNSMPFS